MTDITNPHTNAQIVLQPVYPTEFFSALLLAPLAATIVLSPFYNSTVVILFGAPAYLLMGGPFYWHVLRRVKGTDWPIVECVAAGIGANICAYPLNFIFLSWVFNLPSLFTGFALVFGFVFAPVWSACFAILYTTFVRGRRGQD